MLLDEPVERLGQALRLVEHDRSLRGEIVEYVRRRVDQKGHERAEIRRGAAFQRVDQLLRAHAYAGCGVRVFVPAHLRSQLCGQGGDLLRSDQNVRRGKDGQRVRISQPLARIPVDALQRLHLVPKKVDAPGIFLSHGEQIEDVAAQGEAPLPLQKIPPLVSHRGEGGSDLFQIVAVPLFQGERPDVRGKKLHQRFGRSDCKIRPRFQLAQRGNALKQAEFGKRALIQQHVVLRIELDRAAAGKPPHLLRGALHGERIRDDEQDGAVQHGRDVALFGKRQVKNRRGDSLADSVGNLRKRTAQCLRF